jgi:hypothetical protein
MEPASGLMSMTMWMLFPEKAVRAVSMTDNNEERARNICVPCPIWNFPKGIRIALCSR